MPDGLARLFPHELASLLYRYMPRAAFGEGREWYAIPLSVPMSEAKQRWGRNADYRLRGEAVERVEDLSASVIENVPWVSEATVDEDEYIVRLLLVPSLPVLNAELKPDLDRVGSTEDLRERLRQLMLITDDMDGIERAIKALVHDAGWWYAQGYPRKQSWSPRQGRRGRARRGRR